MTDIYTTEEFERRYTYQGADLGAVWSREKTVFRVWAPGADALTVLLYKAGDPAEEDLLEAIPMADAGDGTWMAEKRGDCAGLYYTYRAERDGEKTEACDPYARTTGINGQRAMVIDLASTDPKGWEADRNPHAGERITDAVIYELHLRDVSCDPSSGIRNKGKFLGLTERGTKNAAGDPTGLDHIRGLGVTHVHLLPVYDYGSVDETKPEAGQYNWGYDPVNFNVPEGSYSTDPRRGEVRVREMKQMVKALHDSGISVVMDVVYNHVYDAGSFCFNRLVPGYFSRSDGCGGYSNGSGCGNDTASERLMVRKYIADSVKYWAEEYHIDGFRFDLVGLLDVDTINAVMAAVHESRPDVIFYGEGWTMDTHLCRDVPLTTQENSHLTPGFAFFSDTLRDCLRGSVFLNDAPGFVTGAAGAEETLQKCFRGLPDWCGVPAQSVNYASCHDNMALFDRITQAVPGESLEKRARRNKLAAAVYMLSQGVPFFQAGEEMLRSKPLPDGSFDHNSYKSPDSVNSIKWDCLSSGVCRDVCSYYKGLIALRRACGDLRLASAEEVNSRVFPWETGDGLVSFRIRGEQELLVVFNGSGRARRVALPAGQWRICVDSVRAGAEPFAWAKNSVVAEPVSALVLKLPGNE